MTVDVAILERIGAAAAVIAQVDTRVYQLVLPQGVTLPAVRVQLIDDPRRYHLRGAVNLHTALVQTDVFAAAASGHDPYATAVLTADAIDAALTGPPFRAGGSPALVDVRAVFRRAREASYEAGEKREVRIRQDFEVWYRTMS